LYFVTYSSADLSKNFTFFDIFFAILLGMSKPQKIPRTRAPKIRGWGRAGRKVASMVIPSKKEKMARRNRQKSAILKIIEEEIK